VSTDSSTTLLGNNSPLAFHEKRFTKQDHWGNLMDPNDVLVDKTNRPSLCSVRTSSLLLELHHTPFNPSPPSMSMTECCLQIVFGCCVVNDPYLASRKSDPFKTVLNSDHTLRWSVVDLVACFSWMTSTNSAST
jgi:hypothetical protein